MEGIKAQGVGKMDVRQFMTTEVFTVTPDHSIAETTALMKEKKVNRLPVMQAGKLVGLVTDGDLREASPSPATTLSIFELNYLLAKTPIREIGLKKVITCNPDTKIEEAALIMRDHKIGGLPVLEDRQLVGIITESDIFDAFLDILGLRLPGERVVVQAMDQVGGLADVSAVIKDYGVNIASLAINHLPGGRVQILTRLDGKRVDAVKKALIKKGYSVQ